MIIKRLGDDLLDKVCEVAWHLKEVEGLDVVVEPEIHQQAVDRGAPPDLYTYAPQQRHRLGDFIDFVVCLGGDGVLLHTAMLFGKHVPPTVAFHLGSLGFLSQHLYEDMAQSLKSVIHGSEVPAACKVPDSATGKGAYVTLRMRLLCQIKRQGEDDVEESYEVLNEVVLDRGSSSYLTNINVWESNTFVTCVQADGVMIATPTGSTAYSAAAGGSMVHPNVPAILFTPICPHSLNFRPILLPDYSDLKLCVGTGARSAVWVSFDGKHRQMLREGDELRVQMSSYPVPTVNRVDQTQDWMSSLDRCFAWSNRVPQASLNDEYLVQADC